MYVKSIQLANYGPVDILKIEFPFEEDAPKPVLLVGENGSGKSILLSHIANALIAAQGVAFPETPEVASGKVFKLRSGLYISPGQEFYFARVEFNNTLQVSELRLSQLKTNYAQVPTAIPGTPAEALWHGMSDNSNDKFDSISLNDATSKAKMEEAFSRNCFLYFPFDRSEDPAWLNEDNLTAKAHHTTPKLIAGSTSRKVIASSPLRDNQDWLFDVVYDRIVLETKTATLPLPVSGSPQPIEVPIQLASSGKATTMYDLALQVVRRVMGSPGARFGIGPRFQRVVSIEDDPITIVPNVFQLSSGETSLLNIFLSILRDFDMSGSTLTSVEDIQGIVIVDEIDLHLHTTHQFSMLPQLIRMFPKVQFIAATHSPLFILGMNKVFGEDSFAIYQLPEGQQISPEEFSEFGDAYKAYAATRKFNDDVRRLVESSQKPIVFVEGITDLKYIQAAAKVLGKESILEELDLQDGGGAGRMIKMWKDSLVDLTKLLPHQVLLLFDCDVNREPAQKGKLLQRTIPEQIDHPIRKGVENLFCESSLKIAHKYNPAFFITETEHAGTDANGQEIIIPAKWVVNGKGKVNLCDWLCEKGTYEFFRHFEIVFDLLEELLDSTDSFADPIQSETSQ